MSQRESWYVVYWATGDDGDVPNVRLLFLMTASVFTGCFVLRVLELY